MRKSDRTTKELVLEIEKTGIINASCAKNGLSTSTFYRWCNEDPRFRLKIDNAKEIGRKNMVDFAESKLIKNIGNDNERAIEFYLKHNDKRYRSVNGKELAVAIQEMNDQNELSYGLVRWLSKHMVDYLSEDVLRNIAYGNEDEESKEGEKGSDDQSVSLNMQYDNLVSQELAKKQMEMLMDYCKHVKENNRKKRPRL